MKFSAKPFIDLTVHELHDALQLRTNTFVVEQACLYAEVDGRDPSCHHVLVKDNGDTLIGYSRIIPPEENDLPHIGRVVVHIDHRGKGIARELMVFSLEVVKEHFGSRRSALAAQSHL
ncbi:MAG: GNAT family N-acetyltransferase, partial [Bacteroidota bacterium]|nr:GNAT family N-acetyltransferase [Bacteroidota bacterium]